MTNVAIEITNMGGDVSSGVTDVRSISSDLA
jgi:hypothetical protein